MTAEQNVALSYFAKHDPLLLLGFLLIGVAVFLSFRILLRMIKIGEKPYISFFGLPRYSLSKASVNYLRLRKENGWSGWTVYTLAICLVFGIPIFVIGCFRL
jgi:hypothetical protein